MADNVKNIVDDEVLDLLQTTRREETVYKRLVSVIITYRFNQIVNISNRDLNSEIPF